MNTPPLLRRWAVFSLLATFVLPAAASRAADGVIVPEAVAIERPTSAEFAHAEESLQRFLGEADPATKSLVEKFPELISVRPPRPNPAVIPSLNRRF